MGYLIKLVKMARPYWKYLIIAAFSMLAITALNLLGPWLVRDLTGIITSIGKYPNAKRMIINISLILILSYILRIVFQFLNSYLSHYAAWHLVADVRTMVYDKLQQLSFKYFVDKQTGQLMSRIVNDTANFEVLIAHAVPDLFTNALIILGVACILFIINPVLAALSLIPIPFLVLSGTVFAKKILPNFREAQKALADLNADLQDNLSGIREIQIFNKQEKELLKIKEKIYRHIHALLSALKLSALFHPTVSFLSSVGTVIVVSVGGLMALKGKVPVQDIVGFILYLSMFYQPVTALSQVIENVQQALAGAERVFEILQTESEIKEKENAIELKNVQGKITFENVSFSYNPEVQVLKNISFEIQPGQMVAFVGPTGVGKTTIMYLLNRFYDPDSGTIKIDDIDIRDVTLKSLHDNISMVMQDVFLFNGTVAQNIAYGKENATMDEIIQAAKIACAHDFIQNLPQGYDTVIGERGVKLSGGQKQRLAIARAVLKNAPILILDEATSSVDTETENEIQKAINNLAGTRTILIIAHRLSTVKKADKIIVLKDGEIVEVGTHEQLLARKGLYYHLCSVQLIDENNSYIRGEYIMKYRRLGRTNIEVFPIAFGGIPIQRIDEESAIKVIQRAVELGINLIDTARGYTDSEIKIGKALKGINQKVYLASKSQNRTKDGILKDIEISLKNLGVEQIDIYQLHGVNDLDTFNKVFSEDGAYWGLVEAKEKGLIRHIAVSSHSVDILEKLIKTDKFDVIQLCYNIIETEVEEKIFPLALEKDIGIIAMKPMGGGVIPNPTLSLKYVLQKEFVVPDPGIETIEELEENVKVAMHIEPLTESEIREIERIRKEMGKEFCRRCNYCQPCPQEIPIWVILHADSATKRLPYQTLKTGWFYEAYQKAKNCIKCGVCITRCPYNLPIPELIEKNVELVRQVLGE